MKERVRCVKRHHSVQLMLLLGALAMRFAGTLWGAFGDALGLRTEVWDCGVAWRCLALRGNFGEMRAAAYKAL